MAFDCRTDKAFEQGVREKRARGEFGVELTSNEEIVLGQFDDLGQARLGINTREHQASFFHRFLVFIIELVTMTMPFFYVALAIALIGQSTLADMAIVEP